MLHGSPLPAHFFAQPTVRLARSLIGVILIRRERDGSATGGIIVETEAYCADDPASHSFRGETPKNRSMFGPPGTAYVYRSYGIHSCLNVVSAPSGTGEAVLIRALEPVWGIDQMKARRSNKALCSGPGRLCEALGVTVEDHDAADMQSRNTSGELMLRVPGNASWCRYQNATIATRRIGITRGIARLWRFVVHGSVYASRPFPSERLRLLDDFDDAIEVIH